MDILERIIENLTSDEVRRFKILSNRFKADEEKKMLVLFDAIRAGNFKDIENDVVNQFYGGIDAKSKNSYYRLRNKLLSNLEKSLLFYHFNYKNSIESYSNIQLSVLYKERGLYREAYYSLKKAEKVATDYDQFNVLEIVYDEMLQLATHFEVEIEAVISRRKENLRKIEILRANSEILGMITQQLTRRNYSRSSKTHSVIGTLENIKKRLETHKDIFHSASGKIMILKAVVTILIQKSAYSELEVYVKNTFEDFETHKVFNKDNHSTRVMMRIWRVNSLQKLLRLEEAEAEINLLHEDLIAYSKQNYKELAFYYYSSKIYNLKLTDNLEGAAAMLAETFAQKEIIRNEVHELYLLISHADQFFSQEMYNKAVEAIRKIKTHKGFMMVDEELRLYVNVFEIVNFYEAKEYKQAESAWRSLKKNFKSLLKDDFYARATKFVAIVMRLNTAAMEGKTVFIKSAYKNFVTQFSPSEIGDNQIIPYEVYLASKLEGSKSYFQLFIEMIRNVRGLSL
ncbi:MAG: hypothetical protein SF052_23405 [Bacteroidia bacterium]|nr:hypothetical protein [Bacteroidia bacterium]